MKKPLLFGIIAVLAVATLWYATTHSTPPTPAQVAAPATPATAVASTVETQVFEVAVKEGYHPREISAKAGVPVTLKMKTQGTFDCSAAFSIPKLGIRTQFQPTGVATIEIPAQKAGDSIYGVCGMGMFSLVIKFT